MQDESSPVYLNIYDITILNYLLRFIGVGIYHSGVHIFDKEYSYGAHEYNSTGILICEPRKYLKRCYISIYVGEARLSRKELEQEVSRMGVKWVGVVYDIFNNNCNHFCAELMDRLVSQYSAQKSGHLMPSFVNRITYLEKVISCWMPALRKVWKFLGYQDGDTLPKFQTPSKSLQASVDVNVNPSHEEINEINTARSLAMAKSYADRGNTQYISGMYWKSYNSYSTALLHLQKIQNNSDPQVKSFHINTLVSIARCCERLGHFTQVIEFCDIVLKMDATNPKAYLRRAMAHNFLGSYQTAFNDLENAKKYDPFDAQINEELRKLRNKLQGTLGLSRKASIEASEFPSENNRKIIET